MNIFIMDLSVGVSECYFASFFSRDVFGYAANCIKRTFDINNLCYSYFDQRENNLVVIRILTKRNLKLST